MGGVLDFFTSAERLMQVSAYAVYVFGFAVAARLVLARWGRSRIAQSSQEALIENRSREIRRLGKRNLGLKKESKLLDRIIADAEKGLAEVEEKLAGQRGMRRPLFVLHETRRPDDKLFEVEVSHRSRAVPEPFKDNRRTFAVWAIDERRAHSRVALMYKEDQGYVIGGIRPRSAMPPSI